ncbi:hypothetical protein FHT00_000282 [Sphingomonas insulae]|nr:hypothetical protein [Sphingomonas insulae]NIJ28354.1 hypothetical protein [Sphingomonas insulae]
MAKAIDMTRKLFSGAHQSRVDVDTAAKVIGYAGSGGGAAASAIGALRQYGLVDGLRGDLAVSDLAMRILQPMNDQERSDAIREAALKPELFAKISNQFGGKLPSSDEPIRSFLIRAEGFSTGGADEFIGSIRDTLGSLPETSQEMNLLGDISVPPAANLPHDEPMSSPTHSQVEAVGEVMTLPLGQNCKAELRLIGDITAASYGRLIRHLELLREIALEEEV